MAPNIESRGLLCSKCTFFLFAMGVYKPPIKLIQVRGVKGRKRGEENQRLWMVGPVGAFPQLHSSVGESYDVLLVLSCLALSCLFISSTILLPTLDSTAALSQCGIPHCHAVRVNFTLMHFQTQGQGRGLRT